MAFYFCLKQVAIIHVWSLNSTEIVANVLANLCLKIIFITGRSFGQIYSYPAKRWKKKKRSYFASEIRLASKVGDIETGEAGKFDHDFLQYTHNY